METLRENPWYFTLGLIILLLVTVVLVALWQNKKENNFISKFRNLVDKPAEKLGNTIFGMFFAFTILIVAYIFMSIYVYVLYELMLHEVILAYWVNLGININVAKILLDALMSLVYLFIWIVDMLLQGLRSVIDKTYSMHPGEFKFVWLLPIAILWGARKVIPVKIGWLIFGVPFVIGLLSLIWVTINPEAAKQKIAQVKLEQKRKAGTVTTDTADTTILQGRWEERVRVQEFGDLWRLAKRTLPRAEKQVAYFVENGMEGDDNYQRAVDELERVRDEYEQELGKALQTSLELLAGKLPEEYRKEPLTPAVFNEIMPAWRALVQNEKNQGVLRRHILYFEVKAEDNVLSKATGLTVDTVGHWTNIFSIKGSGLMIGMVIFFIILVWGVNYLGKKFFKGSDG